MADLNLPIVEPIGAYSAYAIAVEHGFVGTVDEWLDSLRYDHSEEFLEIAAQVEQAAASAQAFKIAAASSANSAEQSKQEAQNSASEAVSSQTLAKGNADDAQAAANAAAISEGAARAAQLAAETAQATAESAQNAAASSAAQAESSVVEVTESATAAQQSANTATENANKAVSSANAAAVSAGEAADSASSASVSAAAASDSETKAASSAASAESSANSADTSKTAAAASASAAQQSATQAEASASAAQQNAATTGDLKDQAANAAASALTNATAAQQSATQAAGSASTASQSAELASNSAAAASQSQTQSANSASAAAASAQEAALAAASAEEALAENKALINDDATSSDSTWSSAKTNTEIRESTNELTTSLNQAYAELEARTRNIISDDSITSTSGWSSDRIVTEIKSYRIYHQWGVEIPATSTPTCKRLYDAEGMTAAAHLGSYDPDLKNDFDDVFLMKARGERINYDIANRKILAIEGDSNFKLDGTNGDVFVRQIAHWHKREILPDGREIRAIADGPVQGYEYVPERLIPCYLASAADAESENNNGTGTLRSISGARPLTQVSLQNFYEKAKATGCILMDMDTWADQADMMLIEFATRNMQAAIGNGFSSGAYTNTHTALVSESDTNRVVLTTAQANLYIIGQRISISSAAYGTDIARFRKVMSIETYDTDQGWSAISFDGDPVTITIGNYVTGNMLDCGGTNDIIIGSGYIGTNGKAQVKYRGVEDVYGNVFQGLLGVLKVGTHPPIYYYCDNPDYYGFEINDNWREIARRTDGDPEGFVKGTYGDMTAPLATSLIAETTTGASSATYWCDYYYRSEIPEAPEPSRVRVPFFGGNWHSGSNCGPWYGHWHYAPSTAPWPFGARPLVIPSWGGAGGLTPCAI